MNKTAKALLIPIAAFAMSVSSVNAFNPDVLSRAGLNTTQISAFQTAQAYRKKGDKAAARDTLVNAGIDVQTIQAVRNAMHEYRTEHETAIHTAAKNNDYAAFQVASMGSPIADIVTTQAEFERFAEAMKLRENGDDAAAKEIMTELGFHNGEHLTHHGVIGGTTSTSTSSS